MSGLLIAGAFVLAIVVVGLFVLAGLSADSRDPNYSVGHMLNPGRHKRSAG